MIDETESRFVQNGGDLKSVQSRAKSAKPRRQSKRASVAK